MGLFFLFVNHPFFSAKEVCMKDDPLYHSKRRLYVQSDELIKSLEEQHKLLKEMQNNVDFSKYSEKKSMKEIEKEIKNALTGLKQAISALKAIKFKYEKRK